MKRSGATIRSDCLLWVLPPLISAAVALALHWNTLQNEFVWDDRAAVTNNMDVRGETPLSSLLVNDFWGQGMHLDDSHKSYRPVAVLSLRLNFMWGGLDPFSYHAVNLALHALSTAMVAFLAAVLASAHEAASTGGGAGGEETGAVAVGTVSGLVSGVVFACHPVHVEPVASVVGRADLLCGAASLAALLFYLKAHFPLRPFGEPRGPAAKGWPWRRAALEVAALGLAAVSSFAKEVGVTTFGLFVCCEIVEGACAASPPPDSEHWRFGDNSSTSVVRAARVVGGLVAAFFCRLKGADGRVPAGSGGGGAAGAAGRVARAVGGAALVVAVHLSLHGDTTM